MVIDEKLLEGLTGDDLFKDEIKFAAILNII